MNIDIQMKTWNNIHKTTIFYNRLNIVALSLFLLLFRLELDRIYVCVINATWLTMLQWCVNKSRVLWSDLGGQHRITFHSKCNVAAICYLVHLCKEDVCFFAVSSNNIIMSKTIHTRRYISVRPSMIFVRMVVYHLSIFLNIGGL